MEPFDHTGGVPGGLDERPVESAASSATVSGKPVWRPLFGGAGALVLAFVWGALAYRELAPRTVAVAGARQAGVAPAGIVRGTENPPAWMAKFADAFCAKDAEFVATHLGGPLAMSPEQAASALSQRDWTCTGSRFLGAGANAERTFFVYVIQRSGGEEMWFVFSVEDDKVVGVD